MGGYQQATLEVMEHCWAVDKAMPEQALERQSPEDCMSEDLTLVLNIALIVTFLVTTTLIIYGLYEKSRGVSSPIGQCYWYLQ